MFKRWVVVYKHDGSPVDWAIFVHKNKAELFRQMQPNPDKLEVKQYNLTEI